MTVERNNKELIEASRRKNSLVLELPTGFGKTKLALDIIDSYKKSSSILVIVPKRTIIESWKREIEKWKEQQASFLEDCSFTFICYNSIQKEINKTYDFIILDEAHHLSERCREILLKIKTNNNLVFLSATLTREIKDWIYYTFKDNTYIYRATLKQAIDTGLLPSLKIYLVPLEIIDEGYTETFVEYPKAKTFLNVTFETRRPYKKDVGYIVSCTKSQWIERQNRIIENYKQKTYNGNQWAKNIWLKSCGDRLKWLSKIKTSSVKKILCKLRNDTVLTFCSSVKQTQELGKNCINSKKTNSSNLINLFNEGKIKHITACNMLDEGVNLTNCKIGILANIAASERISIQRIGRLLRHDNPILIIPYWKNTREEEIVEKLIADYNPDSIYRRSLEFFN